MALTRVSGRVVYPHGEDTPTPVTGDGVIEYVHATPGVIGAAVHGPDRHRIEYVDGVADEAWLKAGMWRAYVYPSEGRSYTLHLGIPEGGDVTLADVVGEVVPEGIVTRGEQGDPGASVVGGRDNGDGTVSFELSDGTFTEPVVLPPGPAGRGIVSVSDPDVESRVTITYTDGSTSTVQAIRGAQGEPGEPGEPGADSTVPGPANTLAIGTVASGDTASATITGTAPSQTLNLTLPRGEQGIPGTATLPTTGKRRINSSALSTGYVQLERVGPLVTISLTGTNFGVAQLASVTASKRLLDGAPGIPEGFRPPAHTPGMLTHSDWRQVGIIVAFPATDAAVLDLKNIDTTVVTTATNLRASVMFVTTDPWPTTLPGTPIS